MTWRLSVRVGLLACTWACSRGPAREHAVADTLSLAPLADSSGAEQLGGADRTMQTATQPGRVVAGDRRRNPTRADHTHRAGGHTASAHPAAPEPRPAAQGYRESTDSVAPGGSDSGSEASSAPPPAHASRPEASDSGATTSDARTATGDSSLSAAATAVSPAPSPAPAEALPAGTQIRAVLVDSISSLRNTVGQTVTASVSGDLRAPNGPAVLPSGSLVHLTIDRLSPARTRSAKDGELVLRADSVTARGHTYPVDATIQPIPHELRGRGVTAGEVEKVGAGAAAGAVVGAVATGKTKGAVVGGAVGAVGGAVVAAQTASRDVVVPPHTVITLILRSPMVRAR